MHLGNNVICPVTGIPMIAAMGAAVFWAIRGAKADFTWDKILPSVVLTALVFALQMVNFSIPGTSSSGHIIGAVLLAALLGPQIAFLSVAAILLIQSLFFADGGLLALGLNIFNMGFLACFVVYPFVYKPLADNNKPVAAAFLASIAALQLGSITIALEGFISGSIANIAMFCSFMCAIHLAIGIFEGLFTAIVIELAKKFHSSKMFLYITGAAAAVIACVISNYASTKPDGLEWSLLNMSDNFAAQTQGQIYTVSEFIQAKTAILSNMPSFAANVCGFVIAAIFALALFASIANKKVQV